MTNTIDLSKLSPACRDKIVDAVKKILYLESSTIDQDLKDYSPSAARTEMEGWLEATRNLARDLMKVK